METTVTIPDNFQWRFNHKTECWDKVVENSGTETWTAYQYNKETKAWDNVVTLSSKKSSSAYRATASELEYYYFVEKQDYDKYGTEVRYTYTSEEIVKEHKDTQNGVEVKIQTNDGSVPGTVYKWSGISWEKLTSLDSSKKTYFISHGMNNTYQMGWIRDMANALASANPDAQIITIDWGDWASSAIIDPRPSAEKIKPAAARAAILISQITGSYHPGLSITGITSGVMQVDLGLSGELNFIGHSHGAHVCGYLATFSSQKVKTLVGLDISEERAHTYPGGVSWGNTAAETVYYYKSSPMFGGELLLGHYNFVTIDETKAKINGFLDNPWEFGPGTTGHGYSPQWYTLSVNQDNLAGYNITDAPYFDDMASYFKGIVNSPWIGISDSTHKIECLDIGYVNNGSGENKWNFEKYYDILLAVDTKENPESNKSEDSIGEEFRYDSLIRSVGYLTDFSVDNTSVMVDNEITVGKAADIQFTIYNNADNISFAEDFIFDAQQNQDTTFQIWLSTTDKLDTTNTETSICIYEDALRVLPDDGGLEYDNHFDFEESITISSESVNKLFKDFKTKGETDAYIFVRAGGKEGKGEFITGELYSKDNDSQGQLVHIKADQDIKYSFVIDDTGSMSNEIGAVRSGLLRFIDSLRASLEEGEAAPLMQLITFKDNVTHRITTSNLDEMYAAVSGLRATGGDDTPEYSNHAIAQAVRNIGTNGTILFATDAESHAGVNMNNVLAEARSKGVRINSIISGSVSSYSGGGYSYAATPALMMTASADAASGEEEDISDPFGDSAETAGSISVDGTTSGIINYGDNRYDWMKVYLKKDYTYSFALDTVDNKQAFLNLYSTDGKTAIDEGEAGDIIYFSPTTSGTYYLRTRAFDYEDTSYTLNVMQTGEPSTIGTTLESFSILSTYTGGVYEVRSEVKSGDTTGYEAIIYNSLASTLGAAVISCGPYSAQKGSTLDVVISGYGTNWKSGETEVVFDSDKISTLSVTVISPTQLSATIQISSECSNGAYDCSVSTGTEKADGLDVLTVKNASSSPSLVSVVSAGFVQGGDFIATIRGNNTTWTEDSVVSMGQNITISSVEFVSTNELKVHGFIAEDASIGFRTVSVKTDGNSQTLSHAFFVDEKAPTAIPSLTIDGNAKLAAGATTKLTFKGDNITFVDGKTTVDIGDDISIIDISVVDLTTITVTVKANKNTKLGFRDAKITVNGVSASLLNGIEIVSKNNFGQGYSFEDLIFVDGSFKSSKINSKKVNGVALKYEENAFSSIAHAKDVLDDISDFKVVISAPKLSISQDDDLSGVSTIASNAVPPTEIEKENEQSYSFASTVKNELKINNVDGVSTDFECFEKVSVANSDIQSSFFGGVIEKEEKSRNIANVKKESSDTFDYSQESKGTFNVQQSTVGDISNYKSVIVDSSSKVGNVENYNFSEQKTLKNDIHEASIVNTISSSSKGNFSISESSAGNVIGFDNVSVSGSAVQDILRVTEDEKEYSKSRTSVSIKSKSASMMGVYEETVKAVDGGSVSVYGASAGNIENFASVLVDDAIVDNISNSTLKYYYVNAEYILNDKNSYAAPEDYDFKFSDWDGENIICENRQYAASGFVSVQNSGAGDISGFAKVNLANSSAGSVSAITDFGGEEFVCGSIDYTFSNKLSGTEDKINGSLSVSAVVAPADSAVVKSSEINGIYGYRQVVLNNSAVNGDVDFGLSFKSTLTETFKNGTSTISETKNFTYNGNLQAEASMITGDIVNFSSVVLKSSSAGCIELSNVVSLQNQNNSVVSKESYIGSVTLESSSVDSIKGMNKVTASSGFNAIGSYTGSAGNDTFTINKNAVLALGAVDMAGGTKDKFVNNGTLVLTGDFDRSFISGKGEIVAANDVYNELEIKEGVLNLGATADGFRTSKHENSDDTLKKAVKWDLKSDYTGWLGGSDSDVVDLVDCIKFTVSKKDAGMDISVSGVDSYTLFDSKGVELGSDLSSLAAGTYTLQLELDKESVSTSYTLALA